MRYAKDTPRLSVKFIDSKTEEILFEVNNRTWMDIGEIFTNKIVSSLMDQEFKGKFKNRKPPKTMMVMIAEEFTLQSE